MTKETMALDKVSINFQGKIFRKQWLGTGAFTSDALILPYNNIASFSINTSGSPSIYVTNSPEADIDDDSALWLLWDGSSGLNLAITAIKATNAADAYVINLVVKTSE